MRAVVRRVQRALVRVGGAVVGEIGEGLLVYLGVSGEDEVGDLNWLVPKIAGLRIFEDDEDRMNLSLKDRDLDVLVVSQFTLYGNVRKGFRPSFNRAAAPDLGETLYECFVERLTEELQKPVPTGRFRAHMDVEAVDDGPVTILLDSRDKKY
jgi:D-tyrosyl-tRNA(Tyr) deacylase